MSDEIIRLGVVGGTGNEGRGLSLRFAMAGLSVTIGSRDQARAVQTADRLKARPIAGSLVGLDNLAAVATSDIVLLSVPFASVASTIDSCRDAFRPGALVIDVTVPLVFEAGKPRLVPPAEGSAAEHIRALLPESVALACAFKTMPARLLEHVDQPLDCDEFVCGDTQASRDRAMALLQRLPGLRPIDAGPLEAARALEHMTWLAILMNKRYRSHNGRFKIVGL